MDIGVLSAMHQFIRPVVRPMRRFVGATCLMNDAGIGDQLMLTDLFVRLVATGAFHDPRIF